MLPSAYPTLCSQVWQNVCCPQIPSIKCIIYMIRLINSVWHFLRRKKSRMNIENKNFMTSPAGDDKNTYINVTQIYLLIFKQNYNNIGLRWSLKRKKERYTCIYLQLKTLYAKILPEFQIYSINWFISCYIHLKITFSSVKIINLFKAKTKKSNNNDSLLSTSL